MQSASLPSAYGIHEHKHRFAAWCAGRAVRGVKGLNVPNAKEILEAIGLNKICGPDSLPAPRNMLTQHRRWRNRAINAARARGIKLTDGIAAKLINVYLKSVFVCGGDENHVKVAALHPPIDDALLQGLHKKRPKWDVEKAATRWTKLDLKEYERMIKEIKTLMKGQPLWMFEKDWPGHQ